MNQAFNTAYIEEKRAERIKKRCVQHESLVTEISNNLTSQYSLPVQDLSSPHSALAPRSPDPVEGLEARITARLQAIENLLSAVFQARLSAPQDFLTCHCRCSCAAFKKEEK